METKVSSTEHITFDLGVLEPQGEDKRCKTLDAMLSGIIGEKGLKPINHIEYDYTVQIKIKRKKFGEMIMPVMTAQVTATKLLIQTPWQLEIFEDAKEDLMEIVNRKEKEIKRKFKL